MQEECLISIRSNMDDIGEDLELILVWSFTGSRFSVACKGGSPSSAC